MRRCSCSCCDARVTERAWTVTLAVLAVIFALSLGVRSGRERALNEAPLEASTSAPKSRLITGGGR